MLMSMTWLFLFTDGVNKNNTNLHCQIYVGVDWSILSAEEKEQKQNLCSCVSTCEGIHEGGQGPVEHLEKGVSARVLFRSTEDGVLQDVWDPRAVHGGGPELDAETQAVAAFNLKNSLKSTLQQRRPMMETLQK